VLGAVSEPSLKMVYARDEGDEAEFLPFWKLYAEYHYPSKWVNLGTYVLEEIGDKTFIARLNEKGELSSVVAWCDVAEKTKTTSERIEQILTGGSREEKLRLLEAYVEAIKKPFDKVEKVGDGYIVHRLLSPYDQFEDAVLEGRTIDPRTGLQLSLRQAKGQPPEGGFLQKVIGGGDDYYRAVEKGELGYRRGTVVKICGDYNPAVAEYHNWLAVITKVIDPWHYEVVLAWTGKRLILRDTDVKGIVGDLSHDYIGIGKERHACEIVPIIRKALMGKIPLPDVRDFKWPRPPVRQAFAIAVMESGRYSSKYGRTIYPNNPREAVEKALKKAERELKSIEKRKRLYDPEDYRIEHGKAVLWVKLYRLVLKKIERLEKGEDVTAIWKKGYGDRLVWNFTKQALCHEGIPYVEKKDGLYVCKEDRHDAIIAELKHLKAAR
jgi:hypothetical protein